MPYFKCPLCNTINDLQQRADEYRRYDTSTYLETVLKITCVYCKELIIEKTNTKQLVKTLHDNNQWCIKEEPSLFVYDVNKRGLVKAVGFSINTETNEFKLIK